MWNPVKEWHVKKILQRVCNLYSLDNLSVMGMIENILQWS